MIANIPEAPVFWRGRDWTRKEWQAYQKALAQSNLDEQAEQIKQFLLDRNKAYPIKISILGKDPRNWEPTIIGGDDRYF